MEMYVEWLLMPVAEREHVTKTAFADSLGVTTQSLRNYARDPWVQSEMAKRGRAMNKVERVSDVVDNLFRIATGRPAVVDAALDQYPSTATQVSAAKAFLEWTDQVVVELASVDLADMSFDDMRGALDRLEAESLA